ncbi:MAG TPA: hypothetical protein DDZ51_05255 [Planctomycetaceae bacterium]|nr:hypothetical protein [Planctomycetaceae bacterium]
MGLVRSINIPPVHHGLTLFKKWADLVCAAQLLIAFVIERQLRFSQLRFRFKTSLKFAIA